jgi:O-antigen/teichoic acid export membrane protein
VISTHIVQLAPERARAPTTPPAGPPGRAPHARAPRALSMLPNSLALIAAKVATLSLGFLFWLVAARLFPPGQVGLAAGAVAAVLLCTQLGLLGAGAAVISLLPKHARSPSRLLDTALTLVMASGTLVGLAFVGLAAGVFPELGVVGSSATYTLLFAAMSVFGAVGVLLDQVSTSLRRGDEALGRGVLNGALSLVCVGALGAGVAGAGSMAIFACWVVGGAAACALGVLQLRRGTARYRWRPRLEPGLARRLVGLGLPNHVLTLADRAPGLVLPIIVTELLSPEANAYWYAVWMMAWVVFVIPVQVGMTVFAEATRAPAAIDRLVRHGVRVSLGLGVLAAAGLAALASVALSLMGSRYAIAGTDALRVLVWGVVPAAIVQAYYARSRAAHRLREAIATATVSGVLTVAAAATAGVLWGLTAMAAAWVLAQAVTGAWSLWRLSALAARTAAAPARAGAATARPARPRTRAQPRPLRKPGTRRLAEAAALLPVALAVVAWFASVGGVDPREMSSLGMISALPVPAALALAVLCGSFCWQLRRSRVPWPVLLVHVVALVVMVYGLAAVIEPEPRFAVTWRHVGVIDTIQQTGAVDPRIDAYFNWPGFFALSALISSAAGLHSALPLTAWAPVGFELLSLAPLLLIMRALSASARLRWLAVWCFYLTNWIGQDYFSPQAFDYLLYLVVVAAILTWLRATPPRPVRWSRLRAKTVWRAAPPTPSPTAQAAMVGLVIVVVAAMIPSHQLTPFALLPGVAALVALRRCAARGLPLVIAVMLTTWISYMAVDYLAGHTGALTGGLGQLDSTLQESVGGRLQGDRGHVLVADARLVLTAGLWTLAALGAWRRARRGYDDVAALALAGGPFVLPLLQPYGGEILMRIFLFSLPFTAFFVAALFLTPSAVGRSPSRAVLLALLSIVLAGALILTRYGNEQMDWFSRGEVATVDRLYRAAPPHSTLVSWTSSLPWKYRDYADHRYRVVADNPDWEWVARLPAGSPSQVASLERLMRGERRGAYLVLTRSQAAQVELTGVSEPGTVERLRRALADSPAFRLIYANPDGSVFTLAPRARTG